MSKPCAHKIIEAEPRHAPFVAWSILTALRSHMGQGYFDLLMPNCSDEEILRFIEALTLTKSTHWANLSFFMIAEVEGNPAAALSGYLEKECSGAGFRDGLTEASTATGQSLNPEGRLQASTILNVLHDHEPNTWVIDGVATRPEFRRLGLVHALLRESLQLGRQKGARVSDLGVYIGNDTAQKTYERIGYNVVEEKCDSDFESAYKTTGVRLMRCII